MIFDISTWPMTNSSYFIFSHYHSSYARFHMLCRFFGIHHVRVYLVLVISNNGNRKIDFFCKIVDHFVDFCCLHKLFQNNWSFCNAMYSNQLQPFNKAFVTLWNELIFFLFSRLRRDTSDKMATSWKETTFPTILPIYTFRGIFIFIAHESGLVSSQDT